MGPIKMPSSPSTCTRKHFEVVQGSGPDHVAAELAGCVGILIRMAHVTAEDMAKNPQFRVIAKHGMGLDKIDVPPAIQKDHRR